MRDRWSRSRPVAIVLLRGRLLRRRSAGSLGRGRRSALPLNRLADDTTADPPCRRGRAAARSADRRGPAGAKPDDSVTAGRVAPVAGQADVGTRADPADSPAAARARYRRCGGDVLRLPSPGSRSRPGSPLSGRVRSILGSRRAAERLPRESLGSRSRRRDVGSTSTRRPDRRAALRRPRVDRDLSRPATSCPRTC